MDTKQLAERIEETRNDVNRLADELREERDEDKLKIWQSLLSVNNTLVETFWCIMIYRERMGLPVPSPN